MKCQLSSLCPGSSHVTSVSLQWCSAARAGNTPCTVLYCTVLYCTVLCPDIAITPPKPRYGGGLGCTPLNTVIKRRLARVAVNQYLQPLLVSDRIAAAQPTLCKHAIIPGTSLCSLSENDRIPKFFRVTDRDLVHFPSNSFSSLQLESGNDGV